MELSQIRYFILTAQLQNMSKAARVLHITQPTLSKSISNLERELGTQLFDRSGKKLILNEKGRRFLDKAISSIQELDKAALAAQDNLANTTLHIGLFHISRDFMKHISDFSLAHPDIMLEIYHISESAETLDTNQYDMLLYPHSTHFRRYKGQPLFKESYFLAVNRANPLLGKSSFALSDIQNQPLIFIKIENNLFELPYYVCKNSGMTISSEIITNSHEVQRQLIIGGCGIGFVSEGYAEEYKGDDNIEIRPISGENMLQEIMIGFKRQKHLSEGGLLLSEYILKCYKK